MRFKEILSEKYTENNSALLRYLSSGDFDPWASWWAVTLWIERNDYLDFISEHLGKEIKDHDDLNEEEPDVFYSLPLEAQEECAKWVIDYLVQYDPANAPSEAYLSLNRKKLLPRTTWLIHFSDSAEAISSYGFKYGMDEMDKLGLTTYFTDAAKKHGGYNFAFAANSRDVLRASYQKKYGRHAVMFQNSGVHCTHYGDEEDQVIFWGADVDPKDIVLIKNTEYDGWAVIGIGKAGEPVYRGDDLAKCIAWVMKNYERYRSTITRR